MHSLHSAMSGDISVDAASPERLSRIVKVVSLSGRRRAFLIDVICASAGVEVSSFLMKRDMLFLLPGMGYPQRVHGAFVSDNEVHEVVNDLKSRGKAEYIEEILSGEGVSTGGVIPGDSDPEAEIDPLYDQAVAIVTESRRASISSIQRRLKVGYNRAARMVEDMEAAGVVSAVQSNGQREVIAPPPVK